MADPADLNLDELKRRGRRRLIGAIVLALVAAVVVPMLLESDPRPLGEDVTVRIPPVDEGKFVSKLGEPRPKADAPKAAPPAPAPSPSVASSSPTPAREAAPSTPTGDAARKSVGDAEKTVLAPSARPNATETRAPPKAAETAKVAEAAKAPEPPAPKADTPPRADSAAKSEPAKTSATPAAAEPPREGFVVQLAAFSDDKGANALANKLKRAGYPAFTETITTSRGTLWRVRVGGFPSREAAAQSRDRLKAEGHAGIVVPAK
ncbi:MAG TPA: SPOR domain-containing protein [Casimicrobiaceae bacterium]|nr:SPOR domain-containing protein [Casimicrobiaceae bacterium]